MQGVVVVYEYMGAGGADLQQTVVGACVLLT